MGVDLDVTGRLDRAQDRLPKPVGDFVARLREEDVIMPASGLAFFALVSFPPLLIVSVWVVSLLVGDSQVEQLSQRAKDLAPEGMGIGTLVEQVAREGTRLGIGAVVASLWPATAYGSALARGFDRVSPGGRTPLGILWGRGLAVLAILPMFVIGILVAAFLGTTVLDDGVLATVAGPLLALVFGFAAAFLLSMVIYWIFPPGVLEWRKIVRAAVLAAALISFLSLLFVLYLIVGANFQERYASSLIAGLVLLGVWLFMANAVLLAVYAGITRR